MSRKAEFLQYLNQVMPDDAHLFEFNISFATRLHSYPGLPSVGIGDGAAISQTGYEPMAVDGSRCRISFEGML